MSELTREIIPIVVMYGFVLLLAPFIAVTMWVAFDGDRLRVDETATPLDPSVEAAPEADADVLTPPQEAREALGAA